MIIYVQFIFRQELSFLYLWQFLQQIKWMILLDLYFPNYYNNMPFSHTHEST